MSTPRSEKNNTILYHPAPLWLKKCQLYDRCGENYTFIEYSLLAATKRGC